MKLPIEIIRLIIIDFNEDYDLKIKLDLINKINIDKYNNINKKLDNNNKEYWKNGFCFRIIKINDKKYYFLNLISYFLYRLKIRTELRFYSDTMENELIDNTYY